MTVATTYEPAQYNGNSVTTTFAFPYVFFENADLLVTLTVVSTGVDTVQALNTDYSVTGGDGDDGSITFAVAPPTGTRVTIELDLPYTQEDDYVENQAFPANTLEAGLDRAAIRDQQLKSSIDRALKYPPTFSGITDTSLPEPVDGSAIIFDGVTGRMVASADYITDAIADATAGVTGTALITATSTTSLATTGTGSKIWTIESGRGFAIGQRLRAASDDGTKINEGVVVSYSGTTLTINVDYVSGSGTHADWNISVTGDRGASGVGSGDMLASQNLNDVADKPTAFNTIKQAATDTNSGVVELATNAEAITGTDTGRAVTPAGLSAAAFIKLQSTVSVSSGNNVDISTAIPAGVRRVTVLLSGISNNGTGVIGFQLGDSGGYESTGYAGSVTNNSGSTLSEALSTSFALNVTAAQAAVSVYNGKAVFENISGNEWQCTMLTAKTDSAATQTCVGNKTLSSTLTSIRLNSSSTFDAGSASISWEF